MKTLFVGDICPTPGSTPYYAVGDTATLFGDTVDIFRGRDFIFANLECAITESDGRIAKFGPNLKAPPATAKILKELGITVAGISNNHVFDFGKKGALDTINALTSAGIDYTGFGESYDDSRKNYTFEKDGERICVIAVCEHEYSYALDDRMGSRPFDEFETMDDIRAAKATHDRVIVAYHGGKEHCPYPSPRLVRVCRAMVRNGADLVLCQHSHCIGTYESYEAGHILYGQGNFQFVNLFSNETWKTGLAVCYDTKAHTVEFIPIRENEAETGIRLAIGEDKESILRGLDERSKTLKTGEWKKRWHEFCISVKNEYSDKIKRAGLDDSTDMENALFGHYLDCEAHTDVWRELFPTYNLTNEKD